MHDVGRDTASGLLFMALEYLDGETLADRLASGRRFEWREALRITARVAEALHHAHGQGVVHRDIKPANVTILRSGEPRILDFGIARVNAGLQIGSARLGSSGYCRPSAHPRTWPGLLLPQTRPA